MLKFLPHSSSLAASVSLSLAFSASIHRIVAEIGEMGGTIGRPEELTSCAGPPPLYATDTEVAYGADALRSSPTHPLTDSPTHRLADSPTHPQTAN